MNPQVETKDTPSNTCRSLDNMFRTWPNQTRSSCEAGNGGKRFAALLGFRPKSKSDGMACWVTLGGSTCSACSPEACGSTISTSLPSLPSILMWSNQRYHDRFFVFSPSSTGHIWITLDRDSLTSLQAANNLLGKRYRCPDPKQCLETEMFHDLCCKKVCIEPLFEHDLFMP